MNAHKIASLRLIRRRRFTRICAGSVVLAAVGCGRGSEAPRSAPATITVLDPTPVMGGPGWTSQNLVFLTLTGRDEKGELVGRLARSWERSPDRRSVTYRLRTDVRWHDGRPVTAHDVAFTMRLLAHPKVTYFPPSEAEKVIVVDDSTFTTTGHPYPTDTWIVYYPKHLLEKLDPTQFWDWEFWRQPVGNGPYRVVRSVPRLLMELEANPEYYGSPPRIERVVLKSGETAVTELMAGNVDAALLYWRPLDVFKLAGDTRFRIYHDFALDRRKAVAWNQRFEPFRDARVRRALTLAIDRRELLRAMNLPKEVPLSDAPFSPGQWRAGALPSPLGYDPAEARRLLDKVGWREPSVGAVRMRAGAPLRFAMVAENADETEAVLVQAALRRVGVDVQLRVLERQAARSRVFEAVDFDAALFAFCQRPWTPCGLVAWFGAESKLGYRNHEVARVLDSLATYADLDADEPQALYRELEPHFQADLPMTFLYPVTHFFVAHRRVRGLSSPHRANPVESMEKLWLENGKQ